MRRAETLAVFLVVTCAALPAIADEPPPRYGPDATAAREKRVREPIADTLAPGVLMVGVGGLMGINGLIFGTSMHSESKVPLWVGLSGIGLMATGIPLIVIGRVGARREVSDISFSVGPGSVALSGHF